MVSRNFDSIRQTLAENVEGFVAGQNFHLMAQPHKFAGDGMDTRRVSLAFTTTAIKDARHLKRLDLPVRSQHANAILLVFKSPCPIQIATSKTLQVKATKIVKFMVAKAAKDAILGAKK